MEENQEIEELLDPHADEIRLAADQEVTARLRSRGLTVPDGERSIDLADLLSAVERFEAMVESRGGDLMVEDVGGGEPDDPHFVLPQRLPAETTRSHIRRIEAAADALRTHEADTD
ncbi:MAG TPA: hypothetical protein VF187_10140 [Gemmatimonadales bacterium]